MCNDNYYVVNKMIFRIYNENVLFFGTTKRKTNKSDIDLFLLTKCTDLKKIDLFCANILTNIDNPILTSKRGYIDDYGFGVQIIGESGTRYDFNIMPVYLLNNKWRRKVDIIIFEKDEGREIFRNLRDIDWDEEERDYLQIFLIEYTKIYKAYAERKRELIIKYYVRLYENFQKILMCREKQIPNNGDAFRKEGDIPIYMNGDILDVIVHSSEKMYICLKNECQNRYKEVVEKFILVEKIKEFYVSADSLE